MEWIKRILTKIHPQNLLDIFIDAVLLMMEIRVILILLLVVATIILSAVERATNEPNKTIDDTTYIVALH